MKSDVEEKEGGGMTRWDWKGVKTGEGRGSSEGIVGLDPPPEWRREELQGGPTGFTPHYLLYPERFFF